MKLTTGILLLGMLPGAAFAQTSGSTDHTKPATKTATKTAPNVVVVAKPTASKTAATQTVTAKTTAAKSAPTVKAAVKVPAKPASKPNVVAVKAPAKPAEAPAVEDKKNPTDAKADGSQTINLTGRRDPFVSPVVNRSMVGSGCSTGKRCLAIDQISLKGVVQAEAGRIAVVVNALDKAYFLRENDPVFNGYVVKITGDSIVFKETIQDKLGKPFTREVTKKITTPAV